MLGFVFDFFIVSEEDNVFFFVFDWMVDLCNVYVRLFIFFILRGLDLEEFFVEIKVGNCIKMMIWSLISKLSEDN